MPEFDQKVEATPINRVACLGTLRIMDRLSYSRRESGLAYFTIYANPLEGTGGVSVRTNFFFHPTWLKKGFKPSSLQVDPVSVAKAKELQTQAKAADQEVSDEVLDIIRRNSQSFTYSRNIYNLRPPALLQVILGQDGFKKFCVAVDDASPEEFHKLLIDLSKETMKQILFIYESRQAKNQEGDLTNQLELDRATRIESSKDLEEWINAAKNRTVDLMFDPAQIQTV